MRVSAVVATVVCLCSVSPVFAQAKPAPPAAPAAPVGVTPPPDYVIGQGDVLIITYYKDKDMSTDSAVVRPDGKITLPLINDVDAEGLTPEQLRDRLLKVSSKLLVDPSITVGVRAINSRKVFIMGGVNKAGPVDLVVPLDVMSLISVAGGLKEFVDGKKIVILRSQGGKTIALPFNYKEVESGKRLEQNIQLRPGDRVVVPE